MESHGQNLFRAKKNHNHNADVSIAESEIEHLVYPLGFAAFSKME